jgi:hypothetical protein
MQPSCPFFSLNVNLNSMFSGELDNKVERETFLCLVYCTRMGAEKPKGSALTKYPPKNVLEHRTNDEQTMIKEVHTH